MSRFRAATQVAAFFLMGLGGSLSGHCDDTGYRATVPVDSLNAADGRRQVGSLDVTAAVDSATAVVLDALRELGRFARLRDPAGEVDVAEFDALDALDAGDPLAVKRTLAEFIAAYDMDYDGGQSGAEMPALKHETTWQLTYRSDVPDGSAPPPDLQLDRYPGMNITLDDSWVVGLRFEVDYGWAR